MGEFVVRYRIRKVRGLTVISHSEQETTQLGERLAACCTAGKVVAFFGGLGMGKTAFVRGMARTLSPDAHVSSPTFALVNDYGGHPPLVHFDMYRITDADDLFATGYYDYIGNGVIIIEWSENIESELEPDCIRIRISKTGSENERIFEIEGLDDYADVIC